MAVLQAQSHEFISTKSSQTVFQSSRISRSPSLGPPLSLPKTLPLTPFKDDIFISYLYSKLFKREGDENRCGLPKGWVTELVETPQKPRYKSWDALAAIVFGQAHKSQGVIENAHVLYGHALRIAQEPVRV
jgi:hypothetical protein